MTGTARRIFDMALAYAKERKQFDRPIGSFQAIQHKLADMSLALERATAAVQYAAMTCDAAAGDRTLACHSAKAAAGEAARRILKDGAQIHGGIGYTWEHDLHLYLRRATADEDMLGTTSWHLDRIADLLMRLRRGRVRPRVTRRSRWSERSARETVRSAPSTATSRARRARSRIVQSRARPGPATARWTSGSDRWFGSCPPTRA